jgi:outer membrane protein assembly factor BamB
MTRRRLQHAFGAFVVGALVAGCGTTPSWLPSSWSLPAPNFDWLTGRSSAGKPGPMPELAATATAVIDWQASVGASRPGLSPAVTSDAVYAAALDGTVARLDAATGRTVWRISAGKPLSAGPGADATLVAVGTDKGDVLAFDTDGKALWNARVTSEVISPPVVAEGIVVVVSGDGRIFGFAAADGKTRWVNQRTNPPLTVRNGAGGVASRGGVFLGVAGGRLLAMDLQTGTIGWDGAVATPKGATELERIADVTSRPWVEERQACAVAYQGRVACFEIVRGTLNWSRDVSSLSGLSALSAGDAYYVVDDAGAIHALDRATGASLWKQDKLGPRRPVAGQVAGGFLTVIDPEGYVHLLAPSTGAYVGRLATDGSPPTSQPLATGARIVWQTVAGNVYALTAR